MRRSLYIWRKYWRMNPWRPWRAVLHVLDDRRQWRPCPGCRHYVRRHSAAGDIHSQAIHDVTCRWI